MVCCFQRTHDNTVLEPQDNKNHTTSYILYILAIRMEDILSIQRFLAE